MKRNQNTPLNYIEKVNSIISLVASIVVLVALILLFHQLDYQMVQKPVEQAQKKQEEELQAQEEKETAPVVTTASVIAVGDNLYHGSLLNYGQKDTGEWNYDGIYDQVRDVIQAADMAIVDQETVLTTDHTAISSYPSFATPTEVGDALINAGFDVMESSTNHVDDYGYDYIEQTLNFWKTSHPEATVVGIHESQEDADSVKIREVNGIRIAILNYTYGTNNSGAGEGREYMIDMFSQGSDRVAEMVQKAKADSDCVIFMASWGNEDEPMPSEYEKQWATFLMQQGVDVVIGGHPHVLQPYGRMTDNAGHEMVIFYSLGNFVSTQQELPELLGGMGCFTIEKTVLNGETSIRILDQTVKPMVMHYNKDANVFAPYMLEDYSEELAAQHSVRELIGETFTLANLQRKFDEIMSMKVTPSDNTTMLNVSFDYDGNMVDNATGSYVEDYDSVTELQYYADLNINISDY